MSYPNNPTTGVAEFELFERAVSFARRTGAVVVNDNPYSEVTLDGSPTPSILQVDGAKDVAVEFGSLSKTYNMTGWRLGYAVGSRDVIAAMLRVKETIDTGPFGAIQAAGVAALEGPQDVVAESNRRYRRRRDVLLDVLERRGILADSPRATFYVWVRAPGEMSGADFANLLLARCGVVVNPGISYGPTGERYVRASLTVPDDHLDAAAARLSALSFDDLAALRM
jgi:LL-diaminopimelate aminotransferase